MPEKTYPIKTMDSDRVEAAFSGLFPIPNDDQDPPQPKFTQEEWVGEKIQEYVRSIVARQEQKVAQDTARRGVTVPDNIAERQAAIRAAL